MVKDPQASHCTKWKLSAPSLRSQSLTQYKEPTLNNYSHLIWMTDLKKIKSVSIPLIYESFKVISSFHLWDIIHDDVFRILLDMFLVKLHALDGDSKQKFGKV